jgi:hypothetical protein
VEKDSGKDPVANTKARTDDKVVRGNEAQTVMQYPRDDGVDEVTNLNFMFNASGDD